MHIREETGIICVYRRPFGDYRVQPRRRECKESGFVCLCGKTYYKTKPIQLPSFSSIGIWLDAVNITVTPNIIEAMMNSYYRGMTSIWETRIRLWSFAAG